MDVSISSRQFKRSQHVIPPVLTDNKRLVYLSGIFFQPFGAFSFLRQLCPAFLGEYLPDGYANLDLWWVLNASGRNFPLKPPVGSHGATHQELEH
jgi:hypothetical protein